MGRRRWLTDAATGAFALSVSVTGLLDSQASRRLIPAIERAPAGRGRAEAAQREVIAARRLTCRHCPIYREGLRLPGQPLAVQPGLVGEIARRVVDLEIHQSGEGAARLECHAQLRGRAASDRRRG